MIVANLSGGRDSTAMVIRWLELGNDLDYILFCDTGLEFKEMYNYIDKEVSEYLSQKQIINPLYNHFNRTGCFLCPKQSKASLFNLYIRKSGKQ